MTEQLDACYMHEVRISAFAACVHYSVQPKGLMCHTCLVQQGPMPALDLDDILEPVPADILEATTLEQEVPCKGFLEHRWQSWCAWIPHFAHRFSTCMEPPLLIYLGRAYPQEPGTWKAIRST